jgi:hypothetical protein
MFLLQNNLCTKKSSWKTLRKFYWYLLKLLKNWTPLGYYYKMHNHVLNAYLGHLGPRSTFLGTNLDSFEANWIANWIVELDYTLVSSLILGSPNQELSFSHCFLVQTNWISLWNRCHVVLASICHFLVLDPHLKGLGINLKLSTSKIAWIHWSLDLGSSSKVALFLDYWIGTIEVYGTRVVFMG